MSYIHNIFCNTCIIGSPQRSGSISTWPTRNGTAATSGKSANVILVAANLHLYLSEVIISKDYLLSITHWSKQNNPSGVISFHIRITSRLWIWKHPAAKSIKIPLFVDVSPSFLSNTNKSLMLPFPASWEPQDPHLATSCFQPAGLGL